MNIIRDTSTVPDPGWEYPGLNGYTVHTRNYSLFYGLVVEHYQTNGAAPPTQQEVVEYVCAHLAIPCYSAETRAPLINKLVLGIPSHAKGCCGGGKK